jgi:hypothetical protein
LPFPGYENGIDEGAAIASDVVTLVKDDHRLVEQLFTRIKIGG